MIEAVSGARRAVCATEDGTGSRKREGRVRKFLVSGVACAGTVFAIVLLGGSATGDSGGIITIRDAISGKLLPQSIPVQVKGKTVQRPVPFISNGTLQAARDAGRINAADDRIESADPQSDADLIFGPSPTSSLGCAARNSATSPPGSNNVRVNQDCTFRRQAEEEIAFNPADAASLVAGQNDSRVGFNQCGIDWSTDSGAKWGDLLPPFRQHINSPQFDGPNTIQGDAGTLHTYDAGSDPTIAFDADGRAFFSCVVFDVFSNASGLYVTQSPSAAKGSFFFNIPMTGRTWIAVEDNSSTGFTTSVFHDKQFIAADTYASGGVRVAGARNNVYVTWSVFSFDNRCGGSHPGGGYCQSPIFGSMSTNNGRTWSAPEEISGSSSALCSFGDLFDPRLSPNKCDFNQGSDPVVLPNGKLVVAFNNGNTAADNPNGQQLAVVCSPSGNSVTGTARLNCGSPVKVGDDIIVGEPLCNFGRGPEQCVPGAFIRTNDFPRTAVNTSNGNVYVAWQDASNGSSLNIRVAVSTNGGATWSMLGGGTGRINNDTVNHQYMPAIDVDETSGKVAVSYYRTPTGGSTTGPDGTDSVYVLSAGTTPSFAASIISPAFEPPDGAQLGFNGDYSGLTVTPNSRAHPVWSDTRNSAVAGNSVIHDEDIFTDNLALP